jgi:hypothetical protein
MRSCTPGNDPSFPAGESPRKGKSESDTACASCRSLVELMIAPRAHHGKRPTRSHQRRSYSLQQIPSAPQPLRARARAAHIVSIPRSRDHFEDLLQMALVRTARRWDVARNAPHAYATEALYVSRRRARDALGVASCDLCSRGPSCIRTSCSRTGAWHELVRHLARSIHSDDRTDP